MGSEHVSPHFEKETKGGGRETEMFLNINPWPKWWPVKVQQIYNFDKTNFRTDLMFIPVNRTIVFLYSAI